jgi:hypothetical protein
MSNSATGEISSSIKLTAVTGAEPLGMVGRIPFSIKFSQLL